MASFGDPLDSITDPSDWAQTEYPNFSKLDSLLRCHICKDFLKAPVLTSCDHIFCSVCIRRSLDLKNKCPLCSEETFESNLRKVLLLDEISTWFLRNRPDLLDKHKPNSQPAPVVAPTAPVEPEKPKEPIRYESRKKRTADEALVECPVCSTFMSADELQTSHIDTCLSKKAKPAPTRPTISNFFKKERTPQTQPDFVKKKSKISNLDPTISTSKLKEKLNHWNLPTTGTRHQMNTRMKEFINMYNANLDSVNPVDDRVLTNRLLKWEGTYSLEATSKDDDQEGSQWRKKYKSEYEDLIKQAKANMKRITTNKDTE
ncbi:hypothetical protein OGAPHI_005712 [Ogataea philodendri]|uniref:Postreplication repair E3 ubiquitin-protein ligase RAD18 n=1 Tax=Ogataea philodendri TaxID=1378263 RepID=A0A9P8NZA8_9ASCO|nr:uncharacterized protein OGAPHI_005712 [Ogataea philodendri]KAH3662460.1 hypothetical protein OGAPHI_005712 [Ogataea philodendri]